jgi:hypothetical protein
MDETSRSSVPETVMWGPAPLSNPPTTDSNKPFVAYKQQTLLRVPCRLSRPSGLHHAEAHLAGRASAIPHMVLRGANFVIILTLTGADPTPFEASRLALLRLVALTYRVCDCKDQPGTAAHSEAVVLV